MGAQWERESKKEAKDFFFSFVENFLSLSFLLSLILVLHRRTSHYGQCTIDSLCAMIIRLLNGHERVKNGQKKRARETFVADKNYETLSPSLSLSLQLWKSFRIMFIFSPFILPFSFSLSLPHSFFLSLTFPSFSLYPYAQENQFFKRKKKKKKKEKEERKRREGEGEGKEEETELRSLTGPFQDRLFEVKLFYH